MEKMECNHIHLKLKGFKCKLCGYEFKKDSGGAVEMVIDGVKEISYIIEKINNIIGKCQCSTDYFEALDEWKKDLEVSYD